MLFASRTRRSYGLVAVVFTRDQLQASRFVRATEVGMVNNPYPLTPFYNVWLLLDEHACDWRISPDLGEQPFEKRTRHARRRRQALRVWAGACHRDAVRVGSAEGNTFAIRHRDTERVAGGRRHLRRQWK